ncbi:MobC family plasmid mobilization relaxosome protein [Clostridiisalibacter paucivorans]|uniref:MobC family plasmid mobilization relaxosome protein n=1 Tax=Clostridiisalibacter paucivorans TaxID=408753 RepID=UPI001FE1254D|nr:MobC family plasmid mobilization relaxosome protein [Clostridiisalibacter paucivorans]
MFLLGGDTINKTKFIGFRLTEAEYQKIEKKAQKSKMNISQYVSLSALGRDIVVIEDLKELTHQLSKVGNNVNQVTMLAHQGKIKAVDLSSVKKVVEDIWQLLNSLTEKTRRTGR